jgi:hypothetical protein
MRYILILGVVWLAGCQSVQSPNESGYQPRWVGPFTARPPERVDNPALTIEEQESRGRNRWAIPDESAKVGPRSGFAGYGLPSAGDR